VPLAVEINLEFVTYEGTTQCNRDDEFSSGRLLTVTVSKDGNQNNPNDGVYGFFCEAAAYTRKDATDLVTFTKIEIYCADAGIVRSYYHCDIGDYECNVCEEEAFRNSVEEDWEAWMTPSFGLCHGEVDSTSDPNKLSSWKFVGNYDKDYDTWLAFYMTNSCIGDHED